MTLQEKALEIAITQLNVREAPGYKNTGEQVEKYQESTGNKPGEPWCMSFVYWCYEQAADRMGRINPLYKTGHVLTGWRARKDRFRALTPMIGDVFIMDYGKGKGHTGIIVGFTKDGKKAQTIEGNTNDEGSREGFEVCYRERDLSKMLGFLRFV